MKTIGNWLVVSIVGVMLGISAVDFMVGDTSTIGRIVWQLISQI
jgi:hypothetical protein